jgi:hypothetical protein
VTKKTSGCDVSKGLVDLTAYDKVDGAWKEIGLAAPARRALVDAKLLQVSDLRKVSLDKLKALHGMGPNAIRILVSEMKKRDISFRTGK